MPKSLVRSKQRVADHGELFTPPSMVEAMLDLVKDETERSNSSQNATQTVYTFFPAQDLLQSWTDEKLYRKYGITADEIAFIESMIRPMGESND